MFEQVGVVTSQHAHVTQVSHELRLDYTLPRVHQNLLQQAITDVMEAAAEKFDKHGTQVPATNNCIGAHTRPH